MIKLYRKCVGIVVFKSHKVLLCERKDIRGQWQFPQGGIEEGESLIQAAQRELKEETSITSVTPVTVIDTPLYYDFPDEIKSKSKWKYDGQEMQWVLFKFEGKDKEINLQTAEPEFINYKWIEIEEAPKKIVDFKKDVYTIVANHFAYWIGKN